jgi:soluble lytic murein transglycosylase-like protein
MQVTPYTAQDIFARGYTAFRPTKENLLTVRGGLFYGMAYIKILWDDFGLRTKEQITKAYNGGPAYARRGGRTIAMVEAHWGKVSDYLA